MTAVLFVCLGNICRSPIAEGVFRHLVETQGLQQDIVTDSAGIGGWHVGEAPDRRAIAVARRHGVDIAGLRGRKVDVEDFSRFDLILGMDRENVAALRDMQPKGARARVELFLKDRDVPDPYYGDAADFDRAWRLVEEGALSLLERVRSGH